MQRIAIKSDCFSTTFCHLRAAYFLAEQAKHNSEFWLLIRLEAHLSVVYLASDTALAASLGVTLFLAPESAKWLRHISPTYPNQGW